MNLALNCAIPETPRCFRSNETGDARRNSRSVSNANEMTPLKYIRQLQRLIRDTHGCNARHFTTIPVAEMSRAEIVWQGDVEVFDISGHPKAQTCYVWNPEGGAANQAVAVLGIPPVDSAEAAVKIALAGKTRPKKRSVDSSRPK